MGTAAQAKKTPAKWREFTTGQEPKGRGSVDLCLRDQGQSAPLPEPYHLRNSVQKSPAAATPICQI
jgi:hypothetical protein